MAALARVLELTARWREKVRVRADDDSALASVLSWIRTIALEDDVLYLETERWPGASRLGGPGRRRGYFRFRVPSLPSARPEPVTDQDAHTRVRFVIRDRAHTIAGPGWRPVLNLRDLEVIERDAPHGPERPLRLGLGADEAVLLLAQARKSAESFLADGKQDALTPTPPTEHSRLAQRSSVAVALWTRGRLRGSVITSPGPAWRTVGQATVSACQDSRFPRLSPSELTETVFQVGLLHAPRVPLSHSQIATCHAYPDKALFVSEGTLSGAYMPEAFNILPPGTARLQALARTLAKDKAGLKEFGPRARVEVCEVTEFIESADRKRAVPLDGPVARSNDTSRIHAEAAGKAACAWVGAIQEEDGSLPKLVRPSSGKAEGIDIVRSAMTAEALVAFGTAYGFESAVESGRRILGWLDRTIPQWMQEREVALPAMIYRGKAAAYLGKGDALETAAKIVLKQLDGPDPGPLVLAHALSFLDRASTTHAPATRKCESLRLELVARFTQAKASERPTSLAEWAELGAASPLDSRTSREVRDWLRSWQLPSGAFPETTASAFVYSRGTGKVFEVLALRPTEAPEALDRALLWLLSMQYRPDSAFFVPHEHWSRVLGGLRHDYYRPDAWIDAAGHFLLGLARLRSDGP